MTHELLIVDPQRTGQQVSGLSLRVGPTNVIPSTPILFEALDTAHLPVEAWLADHQPDDEAGDRSAA